MNFDIKSGNPCEKKNDFLVSIIMNCYNGEKYLAEAVKSILFQTYTNWELIFWDNQSTDNSSTIVNSYGDSRIRYFYAPSHTNLGEARNLALSKTKGEWIGFIDVDDVWFKDKLQLQIKKICDSQKNIGLVYGRCEFFYDKVVFQGKKEKLTDKFIRPRGRLPESNFARELYSGNFVPFPSVLFSKRALKEIGGIPALEFAPDYYIALAIALKYDVVANSEVLCGYRLHSSNLSLKTKEIGYLDAIKITENLAPESRRQFLSSFNRVRLLIFYLLNFKIRQAFNVFLDLGLYYSLTGILGLLIYKIRYK